MLKHIIFSALLTACSVFAVAQSLTVQEKIESLFINYRTAIITGDGAEIVGDIDSRSLARYQGLLDHIWHSDSATVSELGMADKSIVLNVRARALPAQINMMDREALIEFAIQENLLGSARSFAKASLGALSIAGDSASAPIMMGGVVTPIKYYFYKEKSGWKIDIGSPSRGLQKSDAASQAGKDKQAENNMIFSLMEIVAGKTPGKEVWLPTKSGK